MQKFIVSSTVLILLANLITYSFSFKQKYLDSSNLQHPNTYPNTNTNPNNNLNTK